MAEPYQASVTANWDEFNPAIRFILNAPRSSKAQITIERPAGDLILTRGRNKAQIQAVGAWPGTASFYDNGLLKKLDHIKIQNNSIVVRVDNERLVIGECVVPCYWEPSSPSPERPSLTTAVTVSHEDRAPQSHHHAARGKPYMLHSEETFPHPAELLVPEMAGDDWPGPCIGEIWCQRADDGSWSIWYVSHGKDGEVEELERVNGVRTPEAFCYAYHDCGVDFGCHPDGTELSEHEDFFLAEDPEFARALAAY